MNTEQYIKNIQERYKLGNATEHTFRGDLQQLLESLVPNIRATNEPKRQKCGAPDFILTLKDIPVGFIEAKDIGDKDLEGAKKTGNKEQFDRYKASLNNLIFTDYLDFHLYRDGQFVTKIAIGEMTDKGIKPLPENFDRFFHFIKDFCTHIGQHIKSSKKLAEMMAGKARMLADVIEKALLSDEETQENSTLKDQLLAFKQILIHDITPQAFADVYAQTIAYGLFAARYHDPTLPTFSRQEAYELIPKSNPFLKKLFGYIAGLDLDGRIKWIVDDLITIFLACNVEEILKNYHKFSPRGGDTEGTDPIIHFYEDFLSEYDPKLRKARGVWYTPQPVVGFIVRAVDDILKTEFELPQGLADTSKIAPPTGREVHRVQILDPATGTGTFLAEVVKHIHKKFKGQQGIWSNYVENHLLPRLNGFELLMASYAMAHLKLDLLLTETGYKKPTPELGGASAGRSSQRLKIYLTNSLEEASQERPNLFMAQWLTEEAVQADTIKRDTPVMCIIGNPPYSGESANKGEWIKTLMEDYKKEPGGKEKLNERNPKWINDDYVKFMRYGQHFIEKNETGILAFINPHGYLDNPTFRGMRWHLLKTYDKIYTIDLHGNAKKKETAPDGSIDQNVFDIMQGVSINIFVKTGKKKSSPRGVSEGRGGELAQVFHFDLYGKREFKYDFLNTNSLKTIPFKELPNLAPNYFFVSKDFDIKSEYDKGFSVNELFPLNNVGIVTAKDAILIGDTSNILINNVEKHYKINADKSFVKKISYRPFDSRFVYFDTKLVERSREKIMQHFLKGDNVGLAGIRTNKEKEDVGYTSVFITKNIAEARLADRFITNIFPLYLYPEDKNKDLFATGQERVPNLSMEIVDKIAESLGLPFAPEKKAPHSSSPQEGRCPQDGGGGVKKEYNQISNLPYLKTFRKELRNNLTPAEAKFWTLVQNSKLEGRKFRRQHSVGNYILDFYCPSEKLAIELDGQVHFNEAAQERDQERTLFLNHYGIKVLRFENKLVFEQTDFVLEEIKRNFGWQTTPNGEFIKLQPPLTPPKEGQGWFAPIDLLDYIYAVLHSPTYREKYKEFLKIDFPRVPYPQDPAIFWALVKLGSELRQIHLLESPVVEDYITQYPEDGNNTITKPRFVPSPLGMAGEGSVYINDTQYFANVPQVAWEFYIGGYQPAQKWLKDRKDRVLEFDDILHYQKIIVALTETDRLMKEIEDLEIEG